MDGISDKPVIEFRLNNLRVEGVVSTPPEVHELLLHIVADIQLRCNEMDIYNEQSFPIVEFAFDLVQWQAKRAIERLFQFNSMESDQEGLIYIRPEGTGFILGSISQSREFIEVLSENIIDGFTSEFCEEVGNRTTALVGYDALKYLCEKSLD